MKKIAVIISALLMSGCVSWIPSFWDDNQSRVIVDVRQSTINLNCKAAHLPQVVQLQSQLQWFQLYSESKGQRQQDVLALIKPMQETVTDFVTRSQQQQGSDAYCELKKRVLIQQSTAAASAVLGRF